MNIIDELIISSEAFFIVFYYLYPILYKTKFICVRWGCSSVAEHSIANREVIGSTGCSLLVRYVQCLETAITYSYIELFSVIRSESVILLINGLFKYIILNYFGSLLKYFFFSGGRSFAGTENTCTAY